MADHLTCTPTVRVQADKFDLGALAAEFTAGRTDVGAVVTFLGLCRDDGALTALEIEHYSGMAEAEIMRVATEACGRWPLRALAAVHRYGTIRPGEPIVGVVAASAHRAAAFEAATFMMDYLKSYAPFWKKEHRADGIIGKWVSAKEQDDIAAARWKTS